MNDILFAGWTPNTDKVCARCGGPVESILYMFCDSCHENDLDAEHEAQMLDVADLHYTQETALDRGLQ